MTDEALAWPMVALALWTGLLMIRLGVLRVIAVRSRQVSPKFYLDNRGDEEPERLRFATRHHSNLFEMPVLFYAVCLLLLTLGGVCSWAVGLAWAFVVLRIMHSLVHLTKNVILVRFFIFGLSNLALLGLWAVVIVHLVG